MNVVGFRELTTEIKSYEWTLFYKDDNRENNIWISISFIEMSAEVKYDICWHHIYTSNNLKMIQSICYYQRNSYRFITSQNRNIDKCTIHLRLPTKIFSRVEF